MVFRRHQMTNRIIAAGWLLLAVALGGAAFIVLAGRTAPRSDAAAGGSAPAKAAADNRRGLGADDLAVVWNGLDAPPSATSAPAAKPPSTAPAAAAKPELSFQVRGIVYSTAGSSVAFIELDRKMGLYRVGDAIGEWTIREIGRTTLRIARDQEERIVALGAPAYEARPVIAAHSQPAPAAAPGPSPAAATPGRQYAVRREGDKVVAVRSEPREKPAPTRRLAPPTGADATVAVSAEVLQQARENPMSLLDGVQLAPALSAGKIAGLVLRSVSPGSIAARYGLLAGDRVVAVNGQKIDSTARVLAMYRQYRDSDNVRVTLERGGATKNVIFYSH